MRSSGRVISACLACLVLAPVLAAANGFYVPSVGPGASAMGGAYIGYADDHSAVHWNPAGIVKIQGSEATVSLSDLILLGSRDGIITYYDPYETPGFFAMQGVYATTISQQNLAPGFFVYSDAGPLRGALSKVGICGYTIADYGAKWDAEDVADEFISHPENFNTILRMGDPPGYESRIKGYVVSPVLAKKLSDRLSLGVTGHALYASFSLTNGGWLSTGFYDPEKPPNDQYTLYLDPYEMKEDVSGWGYGATVGLLFDATERLHVGATLRTPITVSMEGDVEVTSTDSSYVSPSQTESFDLTFPMWGGVGMAYDDFLFEGTVLTADAQWTQWSEVEEIVRAVESDLPNGLETTTLNWEDTIEYGVGIDYRLSRSASVRLGYRMSPSPVPDSTFDFVMPMSRKSVFTCGVGYRSDVWTLDAALVYQTGEKRRLEGTDNNMDGKQLDDILSPSLSFTYRF